MKTSIASSRHRLKKALTSVVQFELMPTDLASALRIRPEAFGVHPWQIAVSCSPILGIDKTIEVCCELAKHWPPEKIIPHIACRQLKNTAHCERILSRLHGANITSALFIGGDTKTHCWMPDALSTLKFLQEHKIRDNLLSIGVACYPEAHPTISDSILATDLLGKQKYADYMVSQLCFSGSVTASWLRSARDGGVTLPLFLGVPGIVDMTVLTRLAYKIGVGESLRFLRADQGKVHQLARGYSPETLLRDVLEQFETNFGDSDTEPLLAGLRVYTFGSLNLSIDWRRKLLDELEREC
eukprot:gb/GEZN01013133.1/.p1 GENE.gb/GEZN01013133.1/~~gb/GEZN01013133.1/.p1  ORF type:complete len:298 (+),score=12.88 gb/GEZN01013133.1/:86-979(+)